MEETFEEFCCLGDWDDEEDQNASKQAMLLEKIESLTENEEHIAKAWEFFHSIGAPKFWCAPMVGASELAFRMMVRSYSTHICTTPMIYAGGYAASESYRQQFPLGNPQDRPLIVQFCGDNPDQLVRAAKLVETQCDAVEINFGCPQQCARTGHYGAFLMDSPSLLYELVSAMATQVNVPVLCKVRIFTNYDKTLRMCRLLQNAGCSILTIHGRTRQQKRSALEPADWSVIKRLKEDLRIPVISNGNVRELSDVHDCLEFTGADGVMSACGLLANPALFSGQELCPYFLAKQYIDYAYEYHATAAHIRKHIFSILRKQLNFHPPTGEIFLSLINQDLHLVNTPKIRLLQAIDDLQAILTGKHDEEQREN
jgi:tRNA-dihydrouridine synthase 1